MIKSAKEIKRITLASRVKDSVYYKVENYIRKAANKGNTSVVLSGEQLELMTSEMVDLLEFKGYAITYLCEDGYTRGSYVLIDSPVVQITILWEVIDVYT